MHITKEQLVELQEFQTNLSKYHDAANSVWEAMTMYLGDNELEKRRTTEKKLRLKLSVDYGSLEDTIDELYGSRPTMGVPNMPGMRWDIFAEALGSQFNSTKGDCLNMAEQIIARVVGKAKKIATTPSAQLKSDNKAIFFSDDLLNRIQSVKIKTLCREFNQSWPQSPNSCALLIRTILLATLQYKMGSKAKEDLGPVLNQSISQDAYQDKQIKKILTIFSSMPKQLLDATHHSQWILLKESDLDYLLPGLVKVLEATYPLS